MERGHPCQNGAGVAFQDTDAVAPVTVQLDQIANSDKPEVVPILWTIRQVAGLGRRLLLVSGALPGTGSPMHTPINGHGPPARGFAGQVRAMLLGQQPVNAKTPGPGIRLLEVQDLFEERER